ncbi:MAG: T9SS type A sorting domain-containing protein [candidate division Zixibacteria bacterium]|nr:T9SS type A sorting domain-containing protein [candidate division Zixibacteria bacterium]
MLVFEYSDALPEMPQLGNIASDMNIIYNITDTEIRVLIYSFDINTKINAGQGDLLNLPFGGDGSIRLTDAHFAGYYGEMLKTEFANSALPGNFVLAQNYPNPFNPSTSIDLTVPVACDWEIEIFNTAGQIVRTFDGTTEPGTVSVIWDGYNQYGQSVASGIYFYRVNAADFSKTRKMILLK